MQLYMRNSVLDSVADRACLAGLLLPAQVTTLPGATLSKSIKEPLEVRSDFDQDEGWRGLVHPDQQVSPHLIERLSGP